MTQQTATVDIVLTNGKRAGQTINELTASAVKLNREIKNLKPGSEEFIKKSADLQKVNARLKDVRNEVRGVTDSSNAMLSSFSQFIPFSGQIQKVTTSINFMTAATKSFRAALISTGLGAFVVILGSLVAMFKSSEEGQDRLNKIMKIGGVIIGNLSDIFANLGDKIFKAFSDPQQAVEDLWEVIKNNVINRFTGLVDTFVFFGKTIQSAFELDWEGVKENALKTGESLTQTITGIDDLPGKLQKGFDAATEAVAGFIDETSKEIDAAARVADLEAETNRLERALMVERKQIEAEIAELRLKARQEDQFSAQERTKFLREAGALQDQLLEKDLVIAQNRYEIIQQTNSFSKSTKENLDAEAQALAAVSQVEVERFNQARQIERELQRTRREVEREERAAQEAIRKEREAALKQELEVRKNIQDLALEIMEDGAEKEIAKIQLDTIRKIDALVGSEEQILQQQLLLEELKQQQIQAVKDKYAAEAAEKDKKNKDEQLKRDIELETKKQQIQETGYQAFSDIIGSTIDLIGQDAESRKKNAELIKTFEKARVAVGLQAEIQAIWENAEKNPGNALFPGTAAAIAVVKTIASVARAGLAINKISSTKFATGGFLGGLLKGPSHAFGGIPGVIRSTGQPLEMEGNEFIFSGKATKAIGASRLGMINDYYTRSFQLGGPINPLAPAGQTDASQVDPTAGLKSLEMKFDLYAAKVDEWARNIKVIQLLQETRQGLNTLQTLESDVDI